MSKRSFEALLNIGTSGERSVDDVGSSIKDLSGSLMSVVGSSESAENSLEDLEDEITEVGTSSGEAATGLGALQAQLVATDTIADRVDDDMEDLDDLFSSLGSKSLPVVTKELTKLGTSMENLDSDAIENLDVDAKTLSSIGHELEKLDSSAAQEYIETFAKADDAGEALESFKARTDGVGERFAEISDGIDDINDSGVPNNIADITTILSGDEYVAGLDEEFHGQGQGLIPDTGLEDLDFSETHNVGDKDGSLSEISIGPGQKNVDIDQIRTQLREKNLNSLGDVLKADLDTVRDAMESDVSRNRTLSGVLDSLDQEKPITSVSDLQEIFKEEGVEVKEDRKMSSLLDTLTKSDEVVKSTSGFREFINAEGTDVEMREELSGKDGMDSLKAATAVKGAADRGLGAGMDESTRRQIAENRAGDLMGAMADTRSGIQTLQSLSDNTGVGNVAGQVHEIDDMVKSVERTVTDAKSGDNVEPYNFISGVLSELDGADDFSKARLDQLGEKRIKEFAEGGGFDMGQVEKRLDGSTNTQLDELKSFSQKLENADLDDDILDELIAGGMKKKKGDGIDVSDLMSRMGVESANAQDLQNDPTAKRKLTEGIDSLIQLTTEYDEFANALSDLGDRDTLRDALDEIPGETEAAVQEFGESFGDTFYDILNDPEVVDVLTESIEGDGDMAKALEDAVPDMNQVERAFLQGAMDDIRPEMSERGGYSVQDGKAPAGGVLPREVLQMAVAKRASETDDPSARNVLSNVFNKVGQGKTDSPSLAQTESFNDIFSRKMSQSLVDADIVPEDDADGTGRSIAESTQNIMNEMDNVNTISDLLNKSGVESSVIGQSDLDEEQMADADEIFELFRDSLKRSQTASLRDEDVKKTGAFQRAGGMFSEGLIPSTIFSNEKFDEMADEIQRLNTAGGALVSLNLESVLNNVADSLGMEEKGDRRNNLINKVQEFNEGFQKLMPDLGISSINLGPANVALNNVAKQFSALIALIGPFIAAIGALATTLVTVTGALAAFVGVGAIGFLEQMQQQLGGVNSKAEALERLMKSLKTRAMDALAPLQNAQINGMGGIAAFQNLLDYSFDTLNEIAKLFRDIVEMPVVGKQLSRLVEALSFDSNGPTASALKDMVQKILPILTNMVVYLIDAWPDLLNFMTKITDILDGFGGKGLFSGLAFLLELLGPIITLGAHFLSTIGAAVTMVKLLSDTISDIPFVGDIFKGSITILSALIPVIGTLIGLHFAYVGAVSALSLAWSGLVIAGGTLMTIVSYLPTLFTGLTVAAGSLTTALGYLSTAITAVWATLGGPLTIALVAIIGLFAAWKLELISFEGFFDDIEKGIDGFASAINGLVNDIEWLIDKLNELANAWIKNPAVSAYEGVTGFATDVANTVTGNGGSSGKTSKSKGRQRGGGVTLINNGVMGQKDLAGFVDDRIDEKERDGSTRSGNTMY